jgi:hypothetical protein
MGSVMRDFFRGAAVAALVVLVGAGAVWAASLVGVKSTDVECKAFFADGGPPDANAAPLPCADAGSKYNAYNWISVKGPYTADGGAVNTAHAFIGNKLSATPGEGYPLTGGSESTLDVNTRYGQIYCGASTTGVHVRVFCGRDPASR